MKWIAPISFLVLIIALSATVVFVKALKPASAGAFAFFVAWLVFPHVIMAAALIFVGRKRTSAVHWHVVSVLVFLGGIAFLTDVIFWRPDAQGAIAVLMTPILQCGALAILLPLTWWMSRNA